MFKQLMLNCILGVCLLGFAAPAGADLVINVDVQGNQFGDTAVADYTGASANGPIASDNTWNYFNVGTTDPDGQSLSVGAVTFTFGTDWLGSFSQLTPSIINSLQTDRAFTGTGVTGTFTISGLDTSKDYNLALISGSNANGGFGTDFTIGTTTKTATALADPGSGNGPLTFTEGNTHVLFSGLDGSSGSITFSMTDSAVGSNGVLAGLQLQAIPEPSSVALFGLGSLAMLVRRRRV